MPTLAGNIAYAEGVSAAIAVHGAAGGGAAGWTAARLMLGERFPEASATSIYAIIGYAQRTVAVGTQYASGSPSYAPNRGDLPDVRRIERAAGIPAGEAPAGGFPSLVFHELRVEIIDPETGLPWYTTPVTLTSDGVLNRGELEERAAQSVLGMLRALDTVPAASGRDPIDFQVRVRFRGAYVGYQ